MKNLILCLSLVCLTMIGVSQTNSSEFVRYIEVVGLAEKEVLPDQFELYVCLKEYYNEDKSKKKVSIDLIEKEFSELLNTLMIPSGNVSVSGVGNMYFPEKENQEYFVSKNFNIRLSDLAVLNELLKTVNTKSVSNMGIINMTNKDILQHRKDLRIEALKLAEEKAKYLLESMGEELGQLVSISELDSHIMSAYGAQMMSNTIISVENYGKELGYDLKKIKLTYSIKVKFAIK